MTTLVGMIGDQQALNTLQRCLAMSRLCGAIGVGGSPFQLSADGLSAEIEALMAGRSAWSFDLSDAPEGLPVLAWGFTHGEVRAKSDAPGLHVALVKDCTDFARHYCSDVGGVLWESVWQDASCGWVEPVAYQVITPPDNSLAEHSHLWDGGRDQEQE